MTQEQKLKTLAQKIKDGFATEAETLVFLKEINVLLAEIKNDLKNSGKNGKI
ncbi:MAG: hypothetical protein AAB631_02330 [Patescibacteria group bacterium]